MSKAQILVVEDEAIVAKGIQSDLECLGYSVPTTASSGEEAIAKAEGTHPDLVLMDIVLRGNMDGIQAAEQIRSRLDIPVVYLTAYQDDQTLSRAKITEPFGYLLKPFEEKELHTTIEMALYKHRMEQKLKATERWLSATLQSIADAVIASDARLCIRLMNPVAEALTGWRCDEVSGKDLSEICSVFHEDSPTVLESLATKAIRAGSSVPLAANSRLVSRDGRETPVEGSIAPIHDDDGNFTGVVLVLRDISQRQQFEQIQRQHEEQRRHAEKMEAVSRLAGGIAHDFNNLLTGVLGNTSLARTRLPKDHPSVELLEAAETAAERAAERTKQLLSVSGQAFLRMKPLNLSSAIREFEPALRQAAPRILHEFQLAEDLWDLHADPAQIREVILNLCHNAQQAMPNGGRLTLTTENVVVAEEQLVQQPQAQPGEYVRLSIEDTGQGIAPEIRSRIFEPFFTTKGMAEASGLGLALAHGIVEQHHGWIECISTTGLGTRFDLYFPRYCHPQLPTPPPVPYTRTQRNSTTTILLADDEPMLRELGKTILQNLGYQVLLAEDGAEAVEIFQHERHLIDLVILDLTMPRLSGNDACRQMLEIDPGVRVLFSSGYFAEEITIGEDRIVGFIKKPYRHDELAKTVQAALEQAGVPKRDILLMLTKRLEQALAADWLGRERDWIDRVALVLDRIAQVVRQQALDPEGTGGLSEEIPVTQAAQARQVEGLRGKYAESLEQAIDLQGKLQGMRQAVGSITGKRGKTVDKSQPVEGPIAVDIEAIRHRLEDFRRDLEQHRQEEINLVLESVTTDIGGGD